MVDVAGNYRKILDRIRETAGKCDRHPREVKVLGAAKSQSVELIRQAIAAGISLIGENYVQEAQEKKAQIAGAVEWHMIGHLQRNKAKAAVEIFDLIESLDSVALARELEKQGKRIGKKIRAFVEVNLAGEESKSGIAKADLASLLEAIVTLDHVAVEGLMTVPPFREDPEESRPYFRELRELKDNFNAQRIPHVDLQELSMGMTHDYPVAIEEGATIVRIGTALFGPRKA
jgi:pyridoxal phosphate enzyme (YggS family)